MPPRPKKKTKEEIEAEKIAAERAKKKAEAEAKKLGAERLKAEAKARKKREKEEKERLEREREEERRRAAEEVRSDGCFAGVLRSELMLTRDGAQAKKAEDRRLAETNRPIVDAKWVERRAKGRSVAICCSDFLPTFFSARLLYRQNTSSPSARPCNLFSQPLAPRSHITKPSSNITPRPTTQVTRRISGFTSHTPRRWTVCGHSTNPQLTPNGRMSGKSRELRWLGATRRRSGM